ncbi:putative component of type VI protein secretion system [Rhizobium tibeticum]|uniref:type VI secretion system baseplate subunit TssG n=1 Tax=Rhizobium tibeticum TaxID=501024 RepID=UPI00277F5115|nr:type VI secretion system baseplate subunit TssG [Rhizobium tibeticum]MDP9808302.1 putative component of type VI protein secretion system [Rhizobium tibeticum]
MNGVASEVLPAGTPIEIIAAAEAEIAWWSDAAGRSVERWRWTAVDEADARAMVTRLGYGELAERLTGRDLIVLLALVPQLPNVAHSGPSLAVVLRRWLAVPVRFVPHVAGHLRIAGEDCSRLGRRYNRLGSDLVLGAGIVERGSILAFEVDLRAAGALEQVVADRWVTEAAQGARPADKLVALLEALIPVGLRLGWRFLLPPKEPAPHWRLDAQRLGVDTRLATRGNPDV